MVERVRSGGVCDKCGSPITEVVDDMYVLGQTRGVDAPFDTEVQRSWCSPGCPGPDTD